MKDYFLSGMVLVGFFDWGGGVNAAYATNSSLMEIFGDEKAPIPKVAPLEAGRLDYAQRIFDLSVIGKCKTNNDPNNELKLDIQGRNMPELFAVNDAGKLVYAQPQPMSIITMPRGHCARVIVELEKIKNTYTDAENIPENVKRSEDYLCLGIQKNSKIINALYVVETDKEHASAPVDMDSEEVVELVPLVNSKELSNGCEIAEPNTVVPEDFIAVGETLDFSSVYRINVHAITEPVVRIDGTNVYVNIRAPFMVNAIPQNSITFYDDNKIEDNVGVHTVSEQTTFTFSGGQEPSGNWDEVSSTRGVNFGHNLSKYKVRYSIVSSHITSASLKNQYLRDYGGQYDRIWGNLHAAYKQLILSDGTSIDKSGYVYSIYTFLQKEYMPSSVQIDNISGARAAMRKFSDACVVLGSENWFFTLQAQWGTRYTKTRAADNGLGTSLYWDVYGLSDTSCVFFSNGDTDGGRQHNGVDIPGYSNWLNSFVSCDSADFQKFYTSTGIEIMQIIVKNGSSKSLLNTTTDTSEEQNIAVDQNKGIALQRLDSDLSTQIVAGDYICFQGDGELSVTVEPVDCTFSHTTSTGQTITTTLTEPQTITIDPVNYKYEPCDAGGYVIRFTTEGVTLSLG